ncbi:hypothetical protein [Rhodonellum sp.]|uniref:hypothetical protein n=1 Tax=Rhodonellum sp. TaxID=2231180 RepID=UPI00271AD256|nr:hypothetical protein [Rhodonellum sp.]MDO9554521.1 hypothetical protein [Rhodonellum sp.]
MKTPTPNTQKAIIMSEADWQKNKAWLMQFPATFCMPVIEQMERYMITIPVEAEKEELTDLKK